MPRFLCDSAKAQLDATVARADADTFPAMEFGQPTDLLGGGQLVMQLVVQGAVIEAAGAHHPALVFSSRGLSGPLPNLIFPGSDEQLRGVAELVTEMAEMAIRRADEASGASRA